MEFDFRYIFSLFVFFCLFIQNPADAQKIITIDDHVEQHIFTFNEIERVEDPTGKLTFSAIKSPAFNNRFTASVTSTPQNTKLNSVYWYRIKIAHTPATDKEWLLEFFDQTIDHLTGYLPDGKGRYIVKHLGDAENFANRDLKHKNFELPIKQHNGDGIYYFRIQSHETADIIIVLRSINWFVHYANDEYFTFGIFYGMILIFGFYNLLMFAAVRLRQYLYYMLYLFSIGLYEMCTDGLAFQYLWPASPNFNQYAFAIALCLVSTFCLLFTRDLLHTKVQAPLLHKIITVTIIARIAFFFFCFLVDKSLFNYKFIEFIPLLLAFSTGIYVYDKGYKPARYFVIGYGCLCLGFTFKILIMLHIDWLNTDAITYYSLTISFIAEMIFLSLAIAEQVSMLKRTTDKAQRLMIAEMKKNEALQHKLNKELENLVNIRTHELVEKTAVIEAQNSALIENNKLLVVQAEEISRMNVLLEKDNEELQTNVVKVTRSRIMSEEVDFDEFSKIYPDSESCFAYLAELKWANGYACHKCGNEHYFTGHTPHSRRCAKCDYDESVTAYTIFQNSRIPITKAFYLLFLMYSTKGKISSHKLSEILQIRQGTCWSYSMKIKKLMDEKKKELKQANKEGWSKLVLD